MPSGIILCHIYICKSLKAFVEACVKAIFISPLCTCVHTSSGILASHSCTCRCLKVFVEVCLKAGFMQLWSNIAEVIYHETSEAAI